MRSGKPILLVLAFAVVAAGCSTDSAEHTGAEDDAASALDPTSTMNEDRVADRDDECFVQLFDSDDLDDGDDHFTLKQPGDYSTLTSLPGADDDWEDEADSIRVGGSASVTIWSGTDFSGRSHKLEPGTEYLDIDEEPASLTMTC